VVVPEEDVLRFEVSVQDTDCVRCGHGIAELGRNTPKLGFTKRRPMIGQRATFHVLHHEVRKVVLKTRGVHADDVRVSGETPKSLALAFETPAIVTAGERSPPNFDRYVTIEVDLPGQPHITEPAGTDTPDRFDSRQLNWTRCTHFARRSPFAT
jgi:hypothetical protein